MPTREEYEAMEIIDKITSMKNTGYTEEQIADEVGKDIFNGKKFSLADFRTAIKEKRMEARIAKAKQLSAMMTHGYSLKDAGEALGLNYAEAQSLSLWHHINKEKIDV